MFQNKNNNYLILKLLKKATVVVISYICYVIWYPQVPNTGNIVFQAFSIAIGNYQI